MEKQNYCRLLTQAVCTTGVALSRIVVVYWMQMIFFFKAFLFSSWTLIPSGAYVAFILRHLYSASVCALFTVQPNWLYMHVYSYKYSSCKTGLAVLTEWFFSLGSVHFLPTTEVFRQIFEAVQDLGLAMPRCPNWSWNCWTSHLNCVTNSSQHYQERSLPGACCAKT